MLGSIVMTERVTPREGKVGSAKGNDAGAQLLTDTIAELDADTVAAGTRLAIYNCGCGSNVQVSQLQHREELDRATSRRAKHTMVMLKILPRQKRIAVGTEEWVFVSKRGGTWTAADALLDSLSDR
jgi:hypothetical protein